MKPFVTRESEFDDLKALTEKCSKPKRDSVGFFLISGKVLKGQ